jgi:hypothetical protein
VNQSIKRNFKREKKTPHKVNVKCKKLRRPIESDLKWTGDDTKIENARVPKVRMETANRHGQKISTFFDKSPETPEQTTMRFNLICHRIPLPFKVHAYQLEWCLPSIGRPTFSRKQKQWPACFEGHVSEVKPSPRVQTK